MCTRLEQQFTPKRFGHDMGWPMATTAEIHKRSEFWDQLFGRPLV